MHMYETGGNEILRPTEYPCAMIRYHPQFRMYNEKKQLIRKNLSRSLVIALIKDITPKQGEALDLLLHIDNPHQIRNYYKFNRGTHIFYLRHHGIEKINMLE